MKQKSRKDETQPSGRRLTKSHYLISLRLLRARFSELQDGATPQEVDYYTRAYILDLIGSMIFPDSSGDGVPAMYLEFLQDLQQPKEYNWGAAALAFLYRQLCACAEKDKAEIDGPLPLLQVWCYSRLGIGIIPSM